jgi:DNA helicase-2/ATP-dependent DNA helicase PcrA
MQSPSKVQKEILLLSSGVHIVLAPPGSGKTELLATRVPLAIESGVSPESMLCVTFTNRAARNMKIRIGDMTGKQPFIGTPHRFGMLFLTLNALIPLNTAFLDEEDAEQFLKDAKYLALEKIINDAEGYSVPEYFKDYFNEIKLTKIAHYINQRSIKNLNKDIIKCEYLHDDNLEVIAKIYEDIKRETISIDFNDILNLTLFHLLNTQVSQMNQFKWLQIDEVQDLSELQWNILTRVITDDAHVVYFGDFDQAIYSFMGATHDVLKLFSANADVHHLLENYRSPAKLIDIFNEFATTNLPSRTGILQVPASHQNVGSGIIKVIPIKGTFENEAQAIAQTILPELLDNHFSIAVLTRTNSEADEISNCLSNALIDHFRVSGFDLFRRTEIKDVLAFMQCKQNSLDRLSWC